MRSVDLYHNLANIYIARDLDLISEEDFRKAHRMINETQATDDLSSDADSRAAGVCSVPLVSVQADGVRK